MAAILMAEFYSGPKSTMPGWGDFGQITLPEVVGVHHWIIIAVFIAMYLLFFRWVEKKGL